MLVYAFSQQPDHKFTYLIFNVLRWKQTGMKQGIEIKLKGEFEKLNFFLTSPSESGFLI